MKLFAKTGIAKLWIIFMLISLSMVSVSAVTYAVPHKIGEKFGGGIVFYVDGTGEHGLISAASDLDLSMDWDRAKIECKNLKTNGFIDWRLPTRAELNQLYINKAVVGGFTDLIYWSSTEGKANRVWFQYFDNSGVQSGDFSRSSIIRVRPVRDF
ncbi:MAG: DUF1566 domain-containing protein [Chlorobiaceae bacterium]|nr:DUF1566 domain-containing protein [Chlorobiaceae bacterium]